MKQIALSKGFVSVVDDEDYVAISRFKWTAAISSSARSSRVYAVRRYRKDGKQVTVYMHREIAQPVAGFDIDHRDGDTLNNQRANLRIATRSQNNANSRKRSGATSKYKGVHYSVPTGKWCAQILKQHIGLFDSEEEAALAYDAAARRFGEWRRPNLLERDIEKAIVDLLSLDGWRCFHLELTFSELKSRSVGERGMPDILAVRYPQNSPEIGGVEAMWVEAKRPDGRYSREQMQWAARERRWGATVLQMGIDFPASIEGFAQWYEASGLQRRKVRIGGIQQHKVS